MKTFVTFILMLFCSGLYAQQKIVAGRVTNKDLGTPLMGVTVKSGQNTVTTDVNGKFSIQAVENVQISFSYIGMQTYTYTVTSATGTLDITLEYNSNDL